MTPHEIRKFERQRDDLDRKVETIARAVEGLRSSRGKSTTDVVSIEFSHWSIMEDFIIAKFEEYSWGEHDTREITFSINHLSDENWEATERGALEAQWALEEQRAQQAQWLRDQQTEAHEKRELRRLAKKHPAIVKGLVK